MMSKENLKCHICESLLPLLDKISQQLLVLQDQNPRVYDGEGLRYDLDKVFDSLYNAINTREAEMLALAEDVCGNVHPETELASLLTHLENAKTYCDKSVIYTTKAELLRLTGAIHDRVEELLQEDISEQSGPMNDINFRDDGFPDLLTEIETFGKIFNEKDVNAAVQEKSFPQEHMGIKEDINLTEPLSPEAVPVTAAEEKKEDTSLTPFTESPDKTSPVLGDAQTDLSLDPFRDSNVETAETSSTADDGTSPFNERNNDLEEKSFSSRVQRGYGDTDVHLINSHDMDYEDQSDDIPESNYKEDTSFDNENNMNTGPTRDGSLDCRNESYSPEKINEECSGDSKSPTTDDIIVPVNCSQQRSNFRKNESGDQEGTTTFDESISRDNESREPGDCQNGYVQERQDKRIDPTYGISPVPYETLCNEDGILPSQECLGGSLQEYNEPNDALALVRNDSQEKDVIKMQDEAYLPEEQEKYDCFSDNNIRHTEDTIITEMHFQLRPGNPFSNDPFRAGDASSFDEKDVHTSPQNSKCHSPSDLLNDFIGEEVPVHNPESNRNDNSPFKDDSGSLTVCHTTTKDDYNSQPLDSEPPYDTVNTEKSRHPDEDNVMIQIESQMASKNPDELIFPLDDFNSTQADREDPEQSLARDDDSDNVLLKEHFQMPVLQYLRQMNNNQTDGSGEDDVEGEDMRMSPGNDLLGHQPIFKVDGDSPGSALALFINSNYDPDTVATIDTMIYSLGQDIQSEQDAILSISPKMYTVEHIIKCSHMEFDKATVFEDNHVTRDGKLVNEPPLLPLPTTSRRLKNYKGALSTRPFDSTGMSYLEFRINIEIKQTHDGRSLIFEAAVADRDVIDRHHKVENQENAWGVSLSHCPEHFGLCRRSWAEGKEGDHFPNTLPNEPKSISQLRFGFLLLQKQRKLVVIDCNEERVLMITENIKATRPLWPVFGVYNTELSFVETQLVSSTDLEIEKNIAWLILQNI